MSYVVAVDSGGTFSDCVVVDAEGAIVRAKSPSTPPDFERGVLAAVGEAAARLGVDSEALLRDTTLFAHGTTVATNILITRTGARTALLTTRGHEDAIIIGRTVQKVAGLSESEIVNVARLTKADPLVPRSSIHGVDERMDRNGEVVAPLRLERIEELAADLRREGVEAIAISFLWSFLNPEHEHKLRDSLAGGANGDGAGWFVTASSDLAPVIREYERTATTVLNAYLTPGVQGYLERMGERLRAAGHRGAISVMHSAGGVSSLDEARHRGVTLLSSGPAGGMLGTRELARRLGLDPVIATDVGGTSFDVGTIVDGEPAYADAPVFAKYPVALPIIDVTSIGAGGGSIAWVEPDTGVLRVGPQSAGATPGPACYGAGGTEPTVTDANVVLGGLDPENFLGGRMRLDRGLALEAVGGVAEPLGLEPETAAARIVDIVNSQMADLIRRVTIERGRDPAGFAIFAYGGAAGMHAGAYASKLGCRHVVVPRAAAVFSAFGIGMSDVKRVALISDPSRAPFDLGRWGARFRQLEGSLRREFEEERLPTGSLSLQRYVELQFRGQVHAVRVPVEPADLELDDCGESVIERFSELYEAKYGPGSAYRKAGVEAMTFAVEGIAGLPLPQAEALEDEGPDAAAARRGERAVYFPELGDLELAQVYDADELRPGNELTGPALVEADDTTVLIHPNHRAWVDGFLNLRMELGG